jgi:hypothetical protein
MTYVEFADGYTYLRPNWVSGAAMGRSKALAGARETIHAATEFIVLSGANLRNVRHVRITSSGSLR